MEIRGRLHQAVQGVVVIANTTPIEIIAGRTGKTLFLNYLELSWSDAHTSTAKAYLSDGSGGTDWWNAEFYSNPSYQSRAYSINFGEYGFALTESNGLFGRTSTAAMEFTVVALGYFK